MIKNQPVEDLKVFVKFLSPNGLRNIFITIVNGFNGQPLMVKALMVFGIALSLVMLFLSAFFATMSIAMMGYLSLFFLLSAIILFLMGFNVLLNIAFKDAVEISCSLSMYLCLFSYILFSKNINSYADQYIGHLSFLISILLFVVLHALLKKYIHLHSRIFIKSAKHDDTCMSKQNLTSEINLNHQPK